MKRSVFIQLAIIGIMLFNLSCSNHETNKTSEDNSIKKSAQKDSVEVVDTIVISEDVLENDSLIENIGDSTLDLDQDVIDFLTSLIGEYSLESVDGYIGASMMDFLKIEEGAWKGTGYVLSDAGYEDKTFDLTEDEIKELETMKIIIDDDFNLSLVCKGEKLIESCLYC